MKTFKEIAAQGDLLLVRVESIPKDLTCESKNKGVHIIAHSETGHHHVVDAEHAVFYKTGDDLLSYLRIDKPTEVKHKRSFDTHESILIPVGDYMIKRQREYTPEGFRRAQD